MRIVTPIAERGEHLPLAACFGTSPKGIARAFKDTVGSPEEAARGLLEIAHTAKRPADRIAAWRELLDRGWGKAPAFAAMEAGDPLELDVIAQEIQGIADELRARRTREKPTPSTEATSSWPEPSDPLGVAGNEEAAIDELEGFERADRGLTRGLRSSAESRMLKGVRQTRRVPRRGGHVMARVLVLCALVAAIAAPAALAADPVPADYMNAAKYCKALRASKGVDAFAAQWGTNPNKKNAFGKCVSATNKAKAEKDDDSKKDDEKSDDAAEAKAAGACKKQQAADAAKFAKDYKNFGHCVKAATGDADDDD